MTFRQKSLITGILYISLLFIGPLTLLIFPSMFDTQENIIDEIVSNKMIIKLWIIFDILIILIEIILTSLLYMILKESNKELSFIALISRTLMIAIMFGNLFILLGIENYELLQDSTVKWLFEMHQLGIYVWQVPFFLHVLLIGIIAVKSSYIKTWIGYGLIIGSFGYILDSINNMFGINNVPINALIGVLLGIVAVSEIIFGVWFVLQKNKTLLEPAQQ